MPKVTDKHGKPLSGQLPGIVEAIVIDNVDPDQMGRVKVKFPMLPEAPESFWARLVMPMAGRNRGWMTIPEIEDEVLVAFMHGDINNAIVLGAVYNGIDTPPYANEDQENNLRVFQSRSGHRVTFDDTDGAERVELITFDDSIRVLWDAANKVLSVYSEKDIIIEAKEKISMTCSNFMLSATDSISINAGGDLKVQAGSTIAEQAGGNFSATSPKLQLN